MVALPEALRARLGATVPWPEPVAGTKVFIPSFDFNLSTVEIDGATGDFDLFETSEIVAQERVNAAAIALYRLAGMPPALAFACTPGHGRALAASFRIAGYNSQHVDDVADVETCRGLVADLLAGHFSVLVNIKRLGGRQPIAGLHAVLLARPTRRIEVHQRQLGRVDRSQDVAVVDLVGSCAKFGVWDDAAPEIVTGDHIDVIADPMVSRLLSAPHADIMRWCGSNPVRIELVRKAKNRKIGWSYFVLRAVAGKPAADRWWREHRPNQEIPNKDTRRAATA
jgi:hypothetical protein